MAKTVFNRDKIDFTKQNMFFGADQNTQRYDTFRHPVFDKLNQTMLGYFWRPEEVSLQKDRADFASFRPEQKHIFTSNLKYQTLLDSVQGRGPCLAFLPPLPTLPWGHQAQGASRKVFRDPLLALRSERIALFFLNPERPHPCHQFFR